MGSEIYDPLNNNLSKTYRNTSPTAECTEIRPISVSFRTSAYRRLNFRMCSCVEYVVMQKSEAVNSLTI